MSDIFELEHSGVKGRSGRYPWGSGDRPYQRLEGSRKSPIGRMKAKKAERQAEKDEENKRKKEEYERKLDEDKERVLKSGTATELTKYKGRLTNQELQQAYSRLNLERNIKEMSQKEIVTNKDKINNIMRDIKMGTEWTKTGIEAYNTFARLYNSTDAGKKSPLTMIPGGGDQAKKKK